MPVHAHNRSQQWGAATKIRPDCKADGPPVRVRKPGCGGVGMGMGMRPGHTQSQKSVANQLFLDFSPKQDKKGREKKDRIEYVGQKSAAREMRAPKSCVGMRVWRANLVFLTAARTNAP